MHVYREPALGILLSIQQFNWYGLCEVPTQAHIYFIETHAEDE